MKKQLHDLPHVGIFGKTNSGKSTLFNLILNKEVAIISEIKGTTTDPIYHTFELSGFGRVRLIDTAGIADDTFLSKKRDEKTTSILEKIDLGLYIIDATSNTLKTDLEDAKSLKNRINKPFLLLINKVDVKNDNKEIIKKLNKEVIFLEEKNEEKKAQLYKLIKDNLSKKEDPNLLANLKIKNKNLLLVIPFDSGAPKDRLILPQNKLIQNALALGYNVQMTPFENLKDFLKDNKTDFGLAITDSKIFKEVSSIIPKDMPLTSFSILFARQKGDLKTFYKNIKLIESLKKKEKASIMIIEACTHSKGHEDIGTVLIPKIIKNKLGSNAEVIFSKSGDFNIDRKPDLIIHCGACMLSTTVMKNRIEKANEENIPITNYGLFLAYNADILKRAVEIFNEEL